MNDSHPFRSSLTALLLCGLSLALPAPALADGGRKDEERKPSHPLDPEIKELVESRFKTKDLSVNDGKVTVTYSFDESEQAQQGDWEIKGWDNLDNLHSWGYGYGLTMAAGSRGRGVTCLRHAFTDDYTAEFDLRVERVAPSSIFGILLSEKLALYWGQEPISPKKLAKLGRGAPQADLRPLVTGSTVKVKLVKLADRLTVEVNGRRLMKLTVKKKHELDEFKLGFYGHNVSFSVDNLTITGYLPDYGFKTIKEAAEEAKQAEKATGGDDRQPE